MPTFTSSYGVSEEIETKMNQELMTILKDSQKKVQDTPNKELPNSVRLLGTLTQSALHTPSQQKSVKFVKSMLASFRCARSMEDIAAILGDFVRHRIVSLLTVFTAPMESKSTELRLTITTGSLGLPDVSYYVIANPGRMRNLTKYTNLLKKLGEEFDISNLETLVSLETMAAEQLEVSQADDEILLTGKETTAKYSHIPWDSFARSAFEWSPEKWRSAKILILSTHWLKSLNQWFKSVPLYEWKIWLSGSFLLYMLPILPPPYDDWHFEFFQKTLRGQSEKVPQNRLALKLAGQWLPGPLGEEFIKRYVSKSVKESATALAEEIRSVAKERVMETEWLDASTRRLAKDKIDSIYFGIAYPSHFDEPKGVVVLPDNLALNILNLGESYLKKDLNDANTTLKPASWDDPVFSVNAYYYNEGNRLIIPAGILRYPFFHPAASDGWNFGGIGATFGHELTHAFDMDGKNYDANGNENPWWTSGDNRRYNQKVKQIINLYANTKILNQHINGGLTLSENIADLGGLALSLAALKKRLDKKKVSADKRKEEICNFFTAYAVSWRTKEKKAKVLQSLFMDSHSPPQARVNNIVCQFDDWYECFDVKPGHMLYKAPEQRIRIF